MQFVPLFHFFISSISLVCLHLGSTLSFGFSFLCFVVLSSVPLTLFHLHLIFFFFFFVILINSLLPCRLSVLFLFYFPFVFFFLIISWSWVFTYANMFTYAFTLCFSIFLISSLEFFSFLLPFLCSSSYIFVFFLTTGLQTPPYIKTLS